MSSKLFPLLVLLTVLMGSTRAYAQYDALPFVILNAEDRQLLDDRGHLWDPEDGIWMPSTLSLPERTGLEVFVTHEVCADSIVAWSKSNASQHRELVSAFVNEYRQRGWMLHRHSGVYNLKDINPIADDIYSQYSTVIDYWNDLTRDPRDRYAVALVLHPEEGGPFESIILSEKITKYDGDEGNCPIYYKNRTVLSNVETVRQRVRFRREHGSASSDGSWITFKENFHIQGPTDQRLVIDRLISTCGFEADVEAVRPQMKNAAQEALAVRLLDRSTDGSEVYRQRPFVYAGEDFQRQLYRRTRGDLMRDTLEHYRLDTRSQMSSLLRWVEYREVEPDTVTYLVPQALWKLLLRYHTFDNIRARVRREAPGIPAEVLPTDTTSAYQVTTSMPLFKEFRAYIEAGHEMSDHYTVSSEKDLREGYVSRQNQMNIYPVHSRSRRVRIEHQSAESPTGGSRPYMLRPEPMDTTFSFRWQMPDPNRFYQLQHVSYLHDFIHADTTHSGECDCERQMPLQFLSLSAKTATFDCPPRRHVATDRLVTFKPRARGELSDAVYHLALTFAKNSTDLDLDLGNNRAQMDSLVQKAYDITHELNSRIKRVSVLGISSPEGSRALNLNLSRGRSQSLIAMLRGMGGRELAHASFQITGDSIASWQTIADIIDRDQPDQHHMAVRVRNAIAGVGEGKNVQERLGIDHWHTHPVIEQAFRSVREVQVTYGYTTVLEATERQIVDEFHETGNVHNLQADFYYWLMMSNLTTHDEKVRVAKALLQERASDVRRYTSDLRPTNSYGLVLPIAANILAQDSIMLGHYNRELLAPFIDRSLFQGNFACYMANDPETPVKFINLDVIVYNQILTLCNIGSEEAMAEAYDLLDILNDTPTLSEQFRRTYQPEKLELLLDSHTGNFLHDPVKLEQMRRSNINNLFVVNMADIFSKTEGDLSALQRTDDCAMRLQQCSDSIPSLQANAPDAPSTLYFTAVTRLWQAESNSTLEKDALYDEAVQALCSLFQIQGGQNYISRLQGDSYIRHLYRSAAERRRRHDIYLEAVERYINLTLTN